MQSKTIFAAASLAFLTLAAGPVFAKTLKFQATLAGSSEVPATTSTGTGSVDATYDTKTSTLSWTGTYSGLTGPEVAAHFHGPAAVGKNAGVMVPINAATSPFKGSAKLTKAQVSALEHGMLYVNIHTAANKAGEIRGQVTAVK